MRSRSTRRPPTRSPSPAKEKEEEEEEASGEEEDGQGGEPPAIPAIWMRGPSRLSDRPIPPERRPILRPDGKR
jgi:hypothetical protein